MRWGPWHHPTLCIPMQHCKILGSAARNAALRTRGHSRLDLSGGRACGSTRARPLRGCERSLGIGFAFGDGCAFAVEGEHQRSRSGDVEPRTTKLVASGLAAFGQSSLRSCEISIRPASSPFSAWSWWTVVMGGLALAAAGMSSNPTTETSSGTESPRSVAHAIRTSLLWRIGVAHSSCRISPRERRRAMS